MRYLIAPRPALPFTGDQLNRLLGPKHQRNRLMDDAEAPTERRPDLAEALAYRMNDYPEVC